ncbi:hypothetical protein E143388_04700 [Rhodococcus opacus]|nr:hypothetical protein E143388_04700 [Rhodococcus opacus]
MNSTLCRLDEHCQWARRSQASRLRTGEDHGQRARAASPERPSPSTAPTPPSPAFDCATCPVLRSVPCAPHRAEPCRLRPVALVCGKPPGLREAEPSATDQRPLLCGNLPSDLGGLRPRRPHPPTGASTAHSGRVSPDVIEQLPWHPRFGASLPGVERVHQIHRNSRHRQRRRRERRIRRGPTRDSRVCGQVRESTGRAASRHSSMPSASREACRPWSVSSRTASWASTQ